MSTRLNREIKANQLYQRAEAHWARGRERVAFRHFLAAAKAGFAPAFNAVAQFYDNGTGVKIAPELALYWYKRAYRNANSWSRHAQRRALSTAANNIGCILRDKGQRRAALAWFQRAVQLGDGDANLQIAKMYLDYKRHRKRAIGHLGKTIAAQFVTDGSIEEARELLRELSTIDRQLSKNRTVRRHLG